MSEPEVNQTPTPAETIDPLNATLIDRRDVTDLLSIFRVRPDNGMTPEFEPGQFATLGLPDADAKPSPLRRRRRGPKLIRRAYSIASPPGARDYLEFYLVHIREGGRLTPMLAPMKVGDRVFMDERIKGTFTLDGVRRDRDLVMVATATGLAPYRSMYLHYRNTRRWRRFILIESCREVADLAYYDELSRCAESDPTFIYLPTLTREPADSPWTGLRQRIHDLLDPSRYQQLVGASLDPDQCHVFLCGNPTMIDEAEQYLVRRGFIVQNRKHPDGNVHFERYW